jgi:hypothetical protein
VTNDSGRRYPCRPRLWKRPLQLHAKRDDAKAGSRKWSTIRYHFSSRVPHISITKCVFLHTIANAAAHDKM